MLLQAYDINQYEQEYNVFITTATVLLELPPKRHLRVFVIATSTKRRPLTSS